MESTSKNHNMKAMLDDGKDMHHMLTSKCSICKFLLNGRYVCKISPFSAFSKDVNCPRRFAEAYAEVLDTSTNEHLEGKVVLNDNYTLTVPYSVSLCLKHVGDSSWMSSMNVVSIHVVGIWNEKMR
jgi:hypothetical protein